MFNFTFALNAFKTRTFNQFIATIINSKNRVKVLIVLIIARDNSIKNDFKLYSIATIYLDELNKSLSYEISINKKNKKIMNRCFDA